MSQLKQLNIWDNPPQHSYHVTTDISVPEAIEKEKKAVKQEDLVLGIFRQHKILSASQAWKIYCKDHKNTPVTSIRRACTNLMNGKYLIKTSVMVPGLFGDPEHCYKLA